MKFLVRFLQPVVYQAEHPSARREITSLVVNAPNARGAELHAIRTCAGEIEGLTVEPFIGVFGHPPQVEIVPDIPISIVVSG